MKNDKITATDLAIASRQKRASPVPQLCSPHWVEEQKHNPKCLERERRQCLENMVDAVRRERRVRTDRTHGQSLALLHYRRLKAGLSISTKHDINTRQSMNRFSTLEANIHVSFDFLILPLPCPSIPPSAPQDGAFAKLIGVTVPLVGAPFNANGAKIPPTTGLVTKLVPLKYCCPVLVSYKSVKGYCEGV